MMERVKMKSQDLWENLSSAMVGLKAEGNLVSAGFIGMECGLVGLEIFNF